MSEEAALREALAWVEDEIIPTLMAIKAFTNDEHFSALISKSLSAPERAKYRALLGTPSQPMVSDIVLHNGMSR